MQHVENGKLADCHALKGVNISKSKSPIIFWNHELLTLEIHLLFTQEAEYSMSCYYFIL